MKIIFNEAKIKKQLGSFFIIMSVFCFCSNAYAWRWSIESNVTNLMPFPGGGFDVMPADLTGITDCTSSGLRIQLTKYGLTDSDVHSYLGIVLMAQETGKKLTFIIGDADCYVYRIILK